MRRWIIGLGLEEDERGPLELGAWMRAKTGAEPTVDGLLSIAEEVRAGAVVCGSRRISMTERVFGIVTIESDVTQAQAQERMARAGVRRLPAVDARGVLVGILSLGDIARAAAFAGKNGNGTRQVELTLARLDNARELRRLPTR